MQELGYVPGQPENNAKAINDRGQVIGTTYGSAQSIFLYEPGVGMLDVQALLDFESLGWTLVQGTDINENGDIVGLGRKDGLSRAILLKRME